jgi:hypothetical protein
MSPAPKLLGLAALGLVEARRSDDFRPRAYGSRFGSWPSGPALPAPPSPGGFDGKIGSWS